MRTIHDPTIVPNFLTMADPERTEFTHGALLRAFTADEPLGAVAPRPDDPYVGAMGTGRAVHPVAAPTAPSAAAASPDRSTVRRSGMLTDEISMRRKGAAG